MDYVEGSGTVDEGPANIISRTITHEAARVGECGVPSSLAIATSIPCDSGAGSCTSPWRAVIESTNEGFQCAAQFFARSVLCSYSTMRCRQFACVKFLLDVFFAFLSFAQESWETDPKIQASEMAGDRTLLAPVRS